MNGLSFGVGLPLTDSVDAVCSLATEAEDLGYQFIWTNDDRLGHDPFSVLAAIAQSTTRIQLGPGVTNPYSRHPALIATAIATLDEISEGRAILGLGAGGTNHHELGIDRHSPSVALSEAIVVIRSLLAGSEVTLNGKIVQVHQARLDFVPRRATLPIYIGARGPKVLEVAGKHADGLIIGNIASIEGWKYLLSCVAKGARSAGRDPGDLELVAWFYCCVDDDGEAARQAVRPMVATSLATSRPILAQLGIDLPPRFAEIMEAHHWSLKAECVEAAGQTIPQETVANFSLAGTPLECRLQLEALLRALPSISQVTIVPFPARGRQRADVVRRFWHEVASPLVSDHALAEAR